MRRMLPLAALALVSSSLTHASELSQSALSQKIVDTIIRSGYMCARVVNVESYGEYPEGKCFRVTCTSQDSDTARYLYAMVARQNGMATVRKWWRGGYYSCSDTID
jgi:hypothetical protein